MALDLKEVVAARLGENYQLHERHLNRTLVAAQRVIGFDKVYARAEGAYLYKSGDAGQSWTVFAHAPRGLALIQILDSMHAWATADEGPGIELLFTSDGGAHWHPVDVPAPD